MMTYVSTFAAGMSASTLLYQLMSGEYKHILMTLFLMCLNIILAFVNKK